MQLIVLIFSLVINSWAVSEPETIQLTEFNGRHAALLLAQTCDDRGWNEFARWSQSSGYLNIDQSVKLNLKIDWNRRAVSTDDGKVEFTMLGAGKVHARVNGQSYEGTDSCDLIVKILKRPTHAFWLNLVIPGASAETVSESRGADYLDATVGAVGVVGGLLLTFTPTVIPVALGGATVGVSVKLGGDALSSIFMKRTFEHVLNNDFKVTGCDNDKMTIASGAEEIEVTKFPFAVAVKKNGNKQYSDSKTQSAVNSREVLRKMAMACPQTVTPEKFNQAAASEQIKVQTRILLITPGKAARPQSSTTQR